VRNADCPGEPLAGAISEFALVGQAGPLHLIHAGAPFACAAKLYRTARSGRAQPESGRAQMRCADYSERLSQRLGIFPGDEYGNSSCGAAPARDGFGNSHPISTVDTAIHRSGSPRDPDSDSYVGPV